VVEPSPVQAAAAPSQQPAGGQPVTDLECPEPKGEENNVAAADSANKNTANLISNVHFDFKLATYTCISLLDCCR